jgi:hypothetical protein
MVIVPVLDLMVIEPGLDLCHRFGMIVPNPANLYRVGHGKPPNVSRSTMMTPR